MSTPWGLHITPVQCLPLKPLLPCCACGVLWAT